MGHTALHGSEEHTLRYECAETSVGRLLVVISEHGVVDVLLGDSLHEMLSRATKRFPNSGFFPDRGLHSDWVAAVVKRVELPAASDLIPIDLTFDRRRRAAC
jgi:hypothetical protein